MVDVMNETESSLQYQRDGDVVARDVGGEKILVPLAGNGGDLENLFRLNPVGSVLWDALAVSRDLNELIAAVTAEFDVDDQTARRDIHLFLNDLRAAGLLTINGS